MGPLSPLIVIFVGFVAALWCVLERAPFPFFICCLCIAVGVHELVASLRHEEEQGDAEQDWI